MALLSEKEAKMREDKTRGMTADEGSREQNPLFMSEAGGDDIDEQSTQGLVEIAEEASEARQASIVEKIEKSCQAQLFDIDKLKAEILRDAMK